MPTDSWNSTLYDQKHSFVSEQGKSLVVLLEPQPEESILDIGCGTGHVTKAIAEAGAHIIGIDSSTSMIETACTTTEAIEFVKPCGKIAENSHDSKTMTSYKNTPLPPWRLDTVQTPLSPSR